MEHFLLIIPFMFFLHKNKQPAKYYYIVIENSIQCTTHCTKLNGSQRWSTFYPWFVSFYRLFKASSCFMKWKPFMCRFDLSNIFVVEFFFRKCSKFRTCISRVRCNHSCEIMWIIQTFSLRKYSDLPSNMSVNVLSLSWTRV